MPPVLAGGGGSRKRLAWFFLQLLAISSFVIRHSPALAAEAPAARPTFHASLKSASEAAAADQSLVLLVFSAEWCGPCKALRKNTLDSKEFLEGGGALRVTDVDIDAHEKLARGFAVNAVPNLALLTADGKIVSRRTGYAEVSDLLAWINDGRRRDQAGQWEGTAPGSKLDAFVAKASGDGLDTNDLPRLVALLGEPDPAERAAVTKLLLAQREQAVPSLIGAVGDPYLGVRIGAGELLQRLAPGATFIDPWQSPVERSNTVLTLRKWWSDTGKLPPPDSARLVDPTVQGSIQAALEALRGGDAVRRTEAMSTLVDHGTAALPAVRDAIKRHERTDPRAVTLLEDVRWAILVSDAVERRTGGVRSALARGTGSERQAAAARLGRAGHEAIEPLSELANDADPLVVESAVRSLSGVGGKDVIPAMAALLHASDSNLRMTAAQALGRTRSTNATMHLLTVLNDPNEVVACAALTALDEVNAKDSPFNPAPGAKDVLGADVTAGLKGALSDPRWRVRAAAVGVVGRLRITGLVPDLNKLLDDPDGFVVKNTLMALGGLSAAPEVAQLIEVARRLPALQGDAVAMLAKSASNDTVKAVMELYDSGDPEKRQAILTAVGQREKFDVRPVDDAWKALFEKAASAPQARLRRTAAGLIGRSSPALAAELIGPLLLDEDADTRSIGAEVVLGILAGRKSSPLGAAAHDGVDFDFEEMELTGGVRAKPARTNTPVATPGRLAVWHSNLLQRVGGDPGLSIAAAAYVTGDGKSELPLLAAALNQADERSVNRLAAGSAMKVIVSTLPWPEGRAVLEPMARRPVLYVQAAAEKEKARPEVADYLLDPARFRAALEPVPKSEQTSVLQWLLFDYQAANRRAWSLMTKSEPAQRIVAALLESTNAVWRAAAVYAHGRRDPKQSIGVFEKALKDSNPWVRSAGVQALARSAMERAPLEERVGPLLAEADARLAAWAALALLLPEVRSLAGLDWQFNMFQFEELSVRAGSVVSLNEDQPLKALETKPASLDQARRHLGATNPVAAVIFALLLAQHGEFDGVDRLVAQPQEEMVKTRGTLPDALLTGIALSNDEKYIPFLRRLLDQTQTDWELRKLLRASKGMTGTEARQLRLDVNKRMRIAGAALGN